jgi:hypothetical protein
MPVYFIRAGEAGPVKIGYSRNAESRHRGIQTSHYDALHVIRIIKDGGRATERWLHERFAALRVRLEWFQFDADMLAVEPPEFAEVALPPKPLKPSRLVSWSPHKCPPHRRCSYCRQAAP